MLLRQHVPSVIVTAVVPGAVRAAYSAVRPEKRRNIPCTITCFTLTCLCL